MSNPAPKSQLWGSRFSGGPSEALAAQPGWAWAPVDRRTQEGAPHPGCQRTFARRMTERAARQGLHARVGFEAEWVLEHQFLRLHMKDVASPPKYEAEVYIGFDKAGNRYVAHWMDTFGGGFSSMGFGVRDGNSLPLIFEDADGTVRNTFTYDPATQSWTSLIVQKAKGGDWKTFAEDRLKHP